MSYPNLKSEKLTFLLVTTKDVQIKNSKDATEKHDRMNISKSN